MPYIFRGAGEVKVGTADFGQRPLSSTRDAQPMNSQPGKLSVFAGPRGNRRSHPDCLCRAAFAAGISTRRPQDICSFRTLTPPAFGGHAASGFDSEE